jgi:DNA-binding PadR family transcriptional regulator
MLSTMDITNVDRDAADLTPLTPAVFHILLALADGANHGYAIMREVDDLTGGRMRLGPGTLYRSIQRMLLDGLIVELTAQTGVEVDDERRRRYQLTPLGEAVARAEARRLAVLVEASRARGLLGDVGTRRRAGGSGARRGRA